MQIGLQDLMLSSGVKFGTSGARGLADDMTDYASSLSQIIFRVRDLFADISENGIFGKETANEKVYCWIDK